MSFGFPIVGAAAGTPHDQIPRIGFDGRDDNNGSNNRGSGGTDSRTNINSNSSRRKQSSHSSRTK